MTVAIANTVVAAVEWFNVIVLVPHVILRALAVDELNAPTVKLNPFKFNEPEESVYVHVAENANVAFNVTVPAECINDGVVMTPLELL